MLAASSTDGGGPSSWLDSPAEVDRQKEEEEEEDEEEEAGLAENREAQVVSRNRRTDRFTVRQSF